MVHLLQAANCCRDSRLVVDEDDLTLGKGKKPIVIINQFHALKHLVFRKLSHPSEMQNDALVHREGLKG